MSNDNLLSRSSQGPGNARLLTYAKVAVAVVAGIIVCVVLLKVFAALAPFLQLLLLVLVGCGMWFIYHRIARIEKKLENQNHLLMEIYARLRGPSDPPNLP